MTRAFYCVPFRSYSKLWGRRPGEERNPYVNPEGSRPASQDNDTSRIEAFSDGVFAIAITLLVIEIGVLHLGEKPEGTMLVRALVDWWPSYLGYVISFLVIGTV